MSTSSTSTPVVRPGSLVAVTGATGFVGRAVVDELVQRGYRVRALVRSQDKARDVLGDGSAASLAARNIELAVGDVCDAGVARQCVRGAEACIHLVGIIREVRGETRGQLPQTFERLHVQATRTMVDACAAEGVNRYVHMSALGVGPEGKAAYQKTKWDAELLVRRSGLEWTIVRPSLIHGEHSEFIAQMSDLVSGEMPPWVFLPYFVRIEFDDRVPMHVAPTRMVAAKVQPVAVEDVARAMVSALTSADSVGEVYNLAGPDVVDWQELTETLRDTLSSGNKRLGTFHVPGLHASFIAKGASLIGLGGMLPFDEGQALMATEDNTADCTKAAVDLGFRPAPFKPSLSRYAAKV